MFTRNNAQSANQALAIFAQYLLGQKQQGQYDDAYAKTSQGMARENAGPPPDNTFDEMNAEPPLPPEFVDVLTRMAQDPKTSRLPVFARELQKAAQVKALNSRDLGELSPGASIYDKKSGKIISTAPSNKAEYRDITDPETSGPKIITQGGLMYKVRQRYEGGLLVPNDYAYVKVGDLEAREMAKERLDLAKKQLARAEKEGQMNDYRFWQQQADEWDKIRLTYGIQATGIGANTALTTDQQQKMLDALNGAIASGAIKAETARAIANSLNAPFYGSEKKPTGGAAKPKERPPLDSFERQ